MLSPVETEPDDAALVVAFQNGDERAFDVLVSRHRQRIYRVCRGILRQHELADDACQEAFVKAWHALARFKHESSFTTWMHRIAINAARDARSREASRARTATEAARESPATAPRPPRPVDVMIVEQEIMALRDAVTGLPEKQRATFVLKVQQDLKYTEIAEIMDCPVGTAKANFHHAVQNLKRAFGRTGMLPATEADGAEESA